MFTPGIELNPIGRASRKRLAGRLLIFAALGATVVVPILLGGKEALLATLHFSWRGYIGIFALIVLSWLCRTFKLHVLLQRLHVRAGFGHLLGVSLATDFAFIATPGGLGGYAASIYYLRRTGASASAAAAVTAADQGLDVMFFVLALPCTGLSLIWSSVPQALSTLAFGTSALIALLTVGALLTRHQLAKWLFGENFFTRRWPGLLRKQQMLREFSAKLRAQGRLLLAGGSLFLLGTFVLTALQQLARYGVLWLVLLVLGHSVSFTLMFLLQVLVLQAALWTGVPAGGGAAELGLTATLAAWVPAGNLATALLLWRVATLYFCLIAGAAAIGLLARRSTSSAKHGDIIQLDARGKNTD